MKKRWILLATLIVFAGTQGCGFSRRFIHKPWGKGTYIPAVICAVAGGVGGAAIESKGFTNRSIRGGCSTATDMNGNMNQICDHPAYPEAAAIGAGAGALLCGLAGHYFLDPEPPAPPPPPPPLPTLTPVPEAPPPPPVHRKLVLRGVNFDFDKSDIRPDSRPVLDEAADALKESPNVRVAVEGHTDAVGTEMYNEKLSVRRAEAVFRYLVNHGVAPQRLEVAGYGKSRPVADNETESGRAQNRRVELHVLQPAE